MRAGVRRTPADVRPAPMDLLLALLGRGTAPATDGLGPGDWASLEEAACQHRVAPLLWHRLRERGAAERAPAAVQRRLAELHVLGVLRAEARRRQLAEALAALRSSAIPVVPLKGAFLAEHAYAEAALRPMGDLDLLVPDGALDAAVDALVAVGYLPPDEESRAAYRSHRHPPPLTHPGGLAIELHTTLEPCIAPLRLPLPELWARARPVSAAGEPALALAPEDLLLYLATHMARSHLLGASLISVCDIDVWMDRFAATADWDAVVRRASEGEVRRFVYAALGLAEVALGTRVPREVARALRDDGDDTAIARAMGVLRWPRRFPADPLALLDVRASWEGVQRLAWALVVNPLRHWGRFSTAGVMQTPRAVSTRWATAALFLLSPSSRRAIRRQAAGIEELRRWALEDV